MAKTRRNSVKVQALLLLLWAGRGLTRLQMKKLLGLEDLKSLRVLLSRWQEWQLVGCSGSGTAARFFITSKGRTRLYWLLDNNPQLVVCRDGLVSRCVHSLSVASGRFPKEQVTKFRPVDGDGDGAVFNLKVTGDGLNGKMKRLGLPIDASFWKKVS